MNDRPILRTLAALFLLAGGGQVVGALSVSPADASRDAVPQPMPTIVRADGLVVREEASEASAPSEEVQELTAQRIELRMAAMAMKEERQKMEATRSALAEEKSAERTRLALLYARMPSEKAAKILAALPAERAAGFISAMPGEQGAAILASMTDDEAVAVTEALVAEDF
ncbi:magnesium transporter MgtE N-terminal domain-containing protein [Parvularcula marina]|uniref:magnesium transporter MgtE N-terminal domain-containing protein n=1 Tax=Parvularcula marina TaxID=2292771 RepID=UPI0035148E25